MSDTVFVMSEIITQTALSYNVTPQQLADDIYTVARYLEEVGNPGIHRGRLASLHERGGKYLPVYFLEHDAQPVINGILFEMLEGKRRDKSRGWMVRKNPQHWEDVWASRFSPHSEVARAARERLDALSAERAALAATRPQRPRTRFSQGEYEKFTTLQIGERWAAALILSQQASELFVGSSMSPDATKDDMKDNLYAYLRSLHQQEAADFNAELQYRRNTGDALAVEILDQGVFYFYTRDTVRAMVRSAEIPRWVRYNGAPYNDTHYTEALTDFQITRRFVDLLDPSGDLHARYGDKRVQGLLGILRKQLKNLKEEEF